MAQRCARQDYLEHSAETMADCRSDRLCIRSNCIFIPLIIVIFGLLYKQASLAMEDSNLAI